MIARFCGFDMEFVSEEIRGMAFNELPLWEKYYLPVDPTNLIVLDAGADCGSTAAFFLSRGAQKVISIETEADRVAVFRRNIDRLGWNVELIHGPFALEHMGIQHDLLKLDCEGGETQLYDPGYAGKLKPCVIEAHGNKVAEALCRRFPLKRVYPLSHDMYHLWFLHLQESPLPEFVPMPGLARPQDDMEYMKPFEPEAYLTGSNPFVI